MQDHGKGCFWRVDPYYETKLLQTAFRKRRSRIFVNSNYEKNSLLLNDTNKSWSYHVPSDLMKYNLPSSVPIISATPHQISGSHDELCDEQRLQVIPTSFVSISSSADSPLSKLVTVHHIFNTLESKTSQLFFVVVITCTI